MKTLELQRQNHNIDWSLLCAHDDSPNRTFNILLVVMETPRWITWVKNYFFSLFYYYLISTVFGVYISVGRMIKKKKNKNHGCDILYIYIVCPNKRVDDSSIIRGQGALIYIMYHVVDFQTLFPDLYVYVLAPTNNTHSWSVFSAIYNMKLQLWSDPCVCVHI